jgi:hypothetical protein
VDQAGRAAAGAGREVPLLDKGDRKPAQGSVAGDAGTRNAAADDRDVESFPS